KLLYAHPEMRDKSGKLDVKKRLTVARFLRQAGWFDEADKELDQLLKDLPDKAKEIAEARQAIQSSRIEQLLADIERATKTGRHAWAREQLDKSPASADAKQLASARVLKSNEAAALEAVTQARRHLKAVLERVSDGDDRKLWQGAVTAILAEL